jgi:hypothetical protein
MTSTRETLHRWWTYSFIAFCLFMAVVEHIQKARRRRQLMRELSHIPWVGPPSHGRSWLR